MNDRDVDGLNAGFARNLLEEYLESPDAVPPEWRELFESGESEIVNEHPALARLLDGATPQRTGQGNGHAVLAPAPPPAAAPPDEILLGAVAASMALVKAHRM